MLVVRRKAEESILIGDNIEIKVITLDNGTVQLGINAPKEINIIRKELYTEIENENKEAMKIDLNTLKNIKIK